MKLVLVLISLIIGAAFIYVSRVKTIRISEPPAKDRSIQVVSHWLYGAAQEIRLIALSNGAEQFGSDALFQNVFSKSRFPEVRSEVNLFVNLGLIELIQTKSKEVPVLDIKAPNLSHALFIARIGSRPEEQTSVVVDAYGQKYVVDADKNQKLVVEVENSLNTPRFHRVARIEPGFTP